MNTKEVKMTAEEFKVYEMLLRIFGIEEVNA